jgi:uncharacterized protein (DUF58 family)
MTALAWLIGIQELYALAAAGAVAGGLSWTVLALRREKLSVQVSPGAPLVPRGQALVAQVVVRNASTKTSGLITVSLPVLAPGEQEWSVFCSRSGALAPAGIARAHMDVPTQARGLVTLGPVSVATTDTLGFFERFWSSRTESHVAVHPPCHPPCLASMDMGRPGTRGQPTNRAGADLQDDELASLRNFRDGDDVRLVHWPTTARLGRPVVRQPERVPETRYAVVVDCRTAAHEATSNAPAHEVTPSAPHSLESVLEVAAGIVAGRWFPPGSAWILTTTAGRGAVGDTRGALRALALAGLHPGPPLLRQDQLEGTHVVVVSPNQFAGEQLAKAMTGRVQGVTIVNAGAAAATTTRKGPAIAPARAAAAAMKAQR